MRGLVGSAEAAVMAKATVDLVLKILVVVKILMLKAMVVVSRDQWRQVRWPVFVAHRSSLCIAP